MITKHCGCSTETCGCCEGIEKLTPETTANRPGLPALRYRVGTHGTFFETMKAGLSNVVVKAPGTDGQTLETLWPLKAWTTRDPSDPAIALLDSWATVADVLTFYQERIANEGYLRTATERRSILELARLVGYTLRPGVASSVYLAYTLDEDASATPPKTTAVTIPAGARVQSVPGPGELPQAFETSDPLETHSEWNNLQVRLTRFPDMRFGNTLSLEKFYVAGADTGLKKGDTLLFSFGTGAENQIVRSVAVAEGQFAKGRTLIQLVPMPLGTAAALPALAEFIKGVKSLEPTDTSHQAKAIATRAETILTGTSLGAPIPPSEWVSSISILPHSALGIKFDELLAALEKAVTAAVAQAGKGYDVTVTKTDDFVGKLLEEPAKQFANSAALPRSMAKAFEKNSDAQAQLLVNLAPRLKESYYVAWANAKVNAASTPLQGVYVMRLEAALFGTNASKRPTYSRGSEGGPVLEVDPPGSWLELPLETDDRANDALFLENAYDTITAGSFALVQTGTGDSASIIERRFLQIKNLSSGPRHAYGISGKSTRLTFTQDWRAVSENDDLGKFRPTFVFAQSEPLALVEEAIPDAVQITEDDLKREFPKGIELAALHNGLVSGRWIVISGERADIPDVTGVKVSELLMISGVRQGFDAELPGDKTHTTLLLATPTAYAYKRESVVIYGNVVKATHGETRLETLGAGDGSQAWQTFRLKQPPLTFLPAPTPAGTESTLHVYVNDVEWHETDSLAVLGPKDRGFITKNDNDANTAVTFGNGVNGPRLPTGVDNVKAIYRNGIGKMGNVKAEQISLLQTRPLGVKSVINPLRASGGADKEDRDQGRENAPLGVTSLDRLIGLQDYTDFTRCFAGIAKADARRLSDGRRQLVHVTIAGADDVPIDSSSDLYRNLLLALRKYGDEDLPVQVDLRELIVLMLSASVRLAPDYLWEPVALAIRTALLDTFGFRKRSLAQPVLLCEVIGAIQSVEGVGYVDVDAFGGIPEKKAGTDKNGNPIRRLLTSDELAAYGQVIVMQSQGANGAPSGPPTRVDASVAGFESNTLRPAQLAIFTPEVPDTLILNQIL
jgi:hypothetical protein